MTDGALFLVAADATLILREARRRLDVAAVEAVRAASATWLAHGREGGDAGLQRLIDAEFGTRSAEVQLWASAAAAAASADPERTLRRLAGTAGEVAQ
jgi:hypothetical protein